MKRNRNKTDKNDTGRKIRALLLSFSLFLNIQTMPAAQEFFNLTASDVKIDSMLPRFTYQRELGSAYADSVYTISIAYPEYIDMTADDISRLKAIGCETLSAEPEIEQYIGVSRKEGTLYASIVPLVCRDGRYQKLVSFMLKVDAKAAEGAAMARRQAGATDGRYADNSILATGRWAKISVPETGVYQLTDALCRQAGFSNPARVKIYGYGGAMQPEKLTADYLAATDDLKEVAVCEVGGKRLFHAIGPVSWATPTALTRTRNPYSNYGCYFLTESDGEPLRVDSATFVGSFYPTNDDYHSLYEKDEYSWFHGGRNFFESAQLGVGTAHTYNLKATSQSGTLTIAMTYNGNCQATVTLNGTELEGGLEVSPTTINKKTANEIDKYSSAALTVWTFKADNLHTDNTIVITQTSGSQMRLDYIAITSNEPAPEPKLTTGTFAAPSYVYNITNQNHHADTAVDMVIIIPTTQKLLQQAERIKALHEGLDSMRVRIVPADELFNEYSSGTPDANAYRRYMKMLYDRAETNADMPRYLLLFGDGAWDNRMVTSDWHNYSPDDFLLCYESENSFSETECYVSDDYFGFLDDNEGGNLLRSDKSDLAIGRFPVRTDAQAKIVVDKTISYHNNEYAGAWQNTIVFMGDDGNYNQHMDDAETVVKMVEENYPSFNIKRIYWDAYVRTTSSTGNSYPDATRLIRQLMQNGALVMNYTGHGAPYCISHEKVLMLDDFQKATSLRLPLWLTASCDIMPFDGQDDNIGESAMLNPNGGAIAFYGTTRTVYSFYNRYMNNAFMRYVLGSTQGVRNSIGEAARLAKNYLINDSKDLTTNKLQYSLLGDPALVLAAPTMDIVIDAINDRPVTETTTVKAGEKVTVTGHVVNADNFNGIMTATVRDVEETVVCKMNDSESSTPFEFKDRPNTIYVGSDSVVNGKFTFTFAMPKDIRYSEGNGMITVYAKNNTNTQEAHGENGNFTMTSSDTEANDGVGPNIYCYLNSSSFVNGGQVNTTPYFYAELTDKDGINAAGNGIGHDLELIVDGDMAKTYSLNSEFQYNFGDYRSGSVGYSIPELSYGQHKLLFRAWDVLNNSSTAELTFNVVRGLEPNLFDVECTHNPAVSNTTFIVTHDRAGSEIDVTLEVFDMSGRKLWSHKQAGASADNSYAIDWDLTVDGGRRLQTGVYLYRVLISSDGSTQASKAKKLIIMKK
ncbi:MAG: type IX secretion system sortase PorU [Prevotella sp.]|nr:type IX secretion system sortase PorU [Prevotella sp.]